MLPERMDVKRGLWALLCGGERPFFLAAVGLRGCCTHAGRVLTAASVRHVHSDCGCTADGKPTLQSGAHMPRASSVDRCWRQVLQVYNENGRASASGVSDGMLSATT